jgi:hypothetical protein
MDIKSLIICHIINKISECIGQKMGINNDW